MYKIRTSAKAIIIHEDKILLSKHADENGKIYYILPGGGQNHYEDLESTVKRECLEEVGAEVKVQDIAFVRDYIEENHEFAGRNQDFHQVELMFLCNITNPHNLHHPTELDNRQVSREWIPLIEISEINLYPKVLKDKIPEYLNGNTCRIYLGDVN